MQFFACKKNIYMCYNKMKKILKGRIKMKIIDSHVHLNLEQFDDDREEVFKRIEEKLDFVVNIGFDLESSEKKV